MLDFRFIHYVKFDLWSLLWDIGKATIPAHRGIVSLINTNYIYYALTDLQKKSVLQVNRNIKKKKKGTMHQVASAEILTFKAPMTEFQQMKPTYFGKLQAR